MNDLAASQPPLTWGAAEIPRRIAAGEVSSRQVVTAFIARIEAVDGRLNAVVVRRFEQALAEAAAADEKQARGESLGPLHGVPLTIKDCFHLAGTTATIGLSARRTEVSAVDGLLTARLKAAGGIILGKTNVPELMIWHECDNPVYGRTNNPFDLKRTPGGSTGGEAAIIAARGSPLGLGNDLGGSIRIPAHFCGIHGLKPTSRRLPRGGSVRNFQGLTAMQSQPGPLARRVEDLELALQVLVDPSDAAAGYDVAPVPFNESRKVNVRGLKIGWFEEDGFFPASSAVKRAVREARDALQQAGATVIPFEPTEWVALTLCYLGIITADGGANLRRAAAGSAVDWRVSRMLLLQRLPWLARLPLLGMLQLAGQQTMVRMLREARPRSADAEWRLIERMEALSRSLFERWNRAKVDIVLCPPHALPAVPHRFPIDLVAAAGYSFVPNVLGLPAGTMSLTRVQDDEQNARAMSRDVPLLRAKQTDDRSTGLPVGVQVVGLPWREDAVLAVMRTLEEAFEARADYPLNVVVPASAPQDAI